MADEFHGHTGIGVKLFFEMKNTQRLRKSPPHQVHTPRPPRPELRANVIDVSNAPGAQLARQPQMKTREVRQNRERRPPALRVVHEPTHRAEQRRQPLQHFGDSHHGNFRIIGDDLDARSAHVWPAHTENSHVQALL